MTLWLTRYLYHGVCQSVTLGKLAISRVIFAAYRLRASVVSFKLGLASLRSISFVSVALSTSMEVFSGPTSE